MRGKRHQAYHRDGNALTPSWLAVAAAALLAALIATAPPAAAQGCDRRWPQIQFARDDLQRAAGEGDLLTAQDYADRARREFDQLAASAQRCGCAAAVAQFEAAAVHIRRAQDAETRKELRVIVNGAKPLFDAALERLQECPR